MFLFITVPAITQTDTRIPSGKHPWLENRPVSLMIVPLKPPLNPIFQGFFLCFSQVFPFFPGFSLHFLGPRPVPKPRREAHVATEVPGLGAPARRRVVPGGPPPGCGGLGLCGHGAEVRLLGMGCW